jgi:hypothetical protein
MDPKDYVDVGGKIVMGNLVGFFVMVIVAWRLWRMMEAQATRTATELAATRAREMDCQKQVFVLAQAAINQSNSEPHEARGRAQTVIDSIAISSSTPIVIGPGPTTAAVVQAAQAPPP